MELELRHLRIVAAIAEHGSVSKAATSLGHSQPSLTAQLQRIERALGGALFERGRHGSRPTALGRVVLGYTATIMTMWTDLQRDIRVYTGQFDDRVIRLSATPGPLATCLLAQCRKLVADYETTLHVDANSDDVASLIAERRLELALVADCPTHELRVPTGVQHAVLATEPLFVLLAIDHHLARRDEIPLAALAEQTWLLGESDDKRFNQHIWTVFERMDFPPPRVQEVPGGMMYRLVAEGYAVALMQATTTPHDGTTLRPILDSPLRLRHILLWPPDSPLAPHIAQLRPIMTRIYLSEAQRSPLYQKWLQQHATTEPPSAPAD